VIIVENFNEAISVINEYAPEHLEIVIEKPESVLNKIINVGSIFLGPYASEPLGDYATGANHTLPTSGFAKMFSPLSVDSFGKMIQIQKVSKIGIINLREDVERMALAEGLDAHKNSVTIRFYDK
jgi:histidinol dehydrogenase